jgi:hypothetical protein
MRDDQTHVICKAKHDLWGAIPPRRDVFGHKALLLRLIKTPRKPEIANFELAVRVHQQIARLKVAVEYISRVDVFQAAQRLVDERLEVRIRERLTGTNLGHRVSFTISTEDESAITYDGMEIGLHKLFVEINFIKVTIWAKDNVHVVKASDLHDQEGRDEKNKGG